MTDAIVEPVITLDTVHKSFGDFVAVHSAHFTINKGEFFSLLGPSGCGKTTLLKMIAGFEQPSSGRILLEGVDVSSVPPHKRNVNTVFQQYALFPHMTVVDNVAFGLRSKGVAPAEARRRSMEMLDIVKLAEFSGRRPAQMSGGQQQRVALARALVNMPSALLLDEPLAALDLKLREAMQIELKRIQREVGITFIFVTHDQGEALTMSDRIAVMSRGRVEQIGTPEEIYNSPASIFVAGFIGSANLLPGEFVRTDSQASVKLDSGPQLSAPEWIDIPDGEPVTVMVRPERISVDTLPAGDGRSMAGIVDNAIFQGSTVRLIAHTPDNVEMIASLEADDDLPSLEIGAPITLRWAADAPFVLRGRSQVIGATTTDVDEVQASLDGVDLGAKKAEAGEPNKYGRRALLVGGAVAGVAAVVGGVLAVTGDGGGGGSDGDTGSLGGGTLGDGADDVRILNWQAYIDPSEDGGVGTVERFTQGTGIKVEYSEDFNDNNETYAREIEPYLANGKTTNFDIMCPTNWMAARLKDLNWLEPLPTSLIPNRVNLEDRFLRDAWNFGATHGLPWQAGITGIAYNPELAGRELKSINDLLDPEFKGRVAALTEMRDTLGLMMLALGHDPKVLDEDAANEAMELLAQLTSDGHFRAFTGNEYLRSLESGDFVACVAWSGDIVQLQYTRPDIQFIIPEEGAMSWYDTMVIPKGAPNGVAAAEWMNFVYDPEQAALLTAYVQYITPVKGVRDELVKLGGDYAPLADSPILFPSDEDSLRLNVFASLPEELESSLTDRFLEITGG